MALGQFPTQSSLSGLSFILGQNVISRCHARSVLRCIIRTRPFTAFASASTACSWRTVPQGIARNDLFSATSTTNEPCRRGPFTAIAPNDHKGSIALPSTINNISAFLRTSNSFTRRHKREACLGGKWSGIIITHNGVLLARTLCATLADATTSRGHFCGPDSVPRYEAIYKR
jgi:hypothetical protein